MTDTAAPTADILRLAQWLSPAFPTGAFAFSHGLDWAISAGEVRDADGAEIWIADTIVFGAGRIDAALLAAAMRGEDAAHLSAVARAMAATRERREETDAQGAAFAATLGAITGQDHPPRPLPVAVGVAARSLSLPPAQVAAVFLHAFATNLVSVAIRFVPLGQSEGQAILSRLHALIETVAAEAAATPLDAIGSTALRGDLMAIWHETQDVRLFRT